MTATAAPPPPQTDTDPGSLTAIQWATRSAGLASGGVPPTDPRVVECHRALAYHRVARAISAEAGQLDPAHIAQLCDQLHTAARTVTG